MPQVVNTICLYKLRHSDGVFWALVLLHLGTIQSMQNYLWTLHVCNYPLQTASCGVVFVFLLSQSKLWNLHHCSVKVGGDVSVFCCLWYVWCLLLGTPVIYFFYTTFQIVLLAVPNVCAINLINQSFFSLIEGSLVLLYPFQQQSPMLNPIQE